MITNTEVVKVYGKLATLKAKRKDLLRTIRTAERSLKKIEAAIDVAEKVDAIVDGVALSLFGGYVKAVSEEISRFAEWYPNAHNGGKTWGLRTYSDFFGRKGEIWHGADWPNQATAKDAAFAWVTKGVRPVNLAAAA
jgi:hypothetical protein